MSLGQQRIFTYLKLELLLGDVQPYVALGQRLVKDRHRVRIATHETFKDFVTGAGLEFFSIGGNPQDLMNYMVKSELSALNIRRLFIITQIPD